jgi:hypothetical protein
MVSHPFAKKKAKGWGTEILFLVRDSVSNYSFSC